MCSCPHTYTAWLLGMVGMVQYGYIYIELYIEGDIVYA